MAPAARKAWFRDLDSNQDTQLQRLMSYRLDDPGIDTGIVAEPRKCSQTRGVAARASCQNRLRREGSPSNLRITFRATTRSGRWSSALYTTPILPHRRRKELCKDKSGRGVQTWEAVALLGPSLPNSLAAHHRAPGYSLPAEFPQWLSAARRYARNSLSAKLVELFSARERWPSGLRRTLGKRV